MSEIRQAVCKERIEKRNIININGYRNVVQIVGFSGFSKVGARNEGNVHVSKKAVHLSET